MIKNIFKSWHFSRVLRLAMGIFLMVEAVKSEIWLLVLIGVVFVTMSLLNIGCCAAGNCTASKENSKNATDEVEYEEIK